MKKYLITGKSYEHRIAFLLFAIVVLSACADRNCINGEGAVETRTLNLQP